MIGARLLLAALLAAGCSVDGGGHGVEGGAGRSPREPLRAEVTYVFDGDTIEVSAGGREERVRLIGIDAPEEGECYADRARAVLAELVEGREVQLERDVSNRDRYDRWLRYASVEGEDINRALVSAGAAVAKQYRPDTARAEELAVAEGAAREAGRGLWGACR